MYRKLIVGALVLLASITVSGCASVPDAKAAQRVDASYVTHSEMLRMKPGYGAVTFKRDSWAGHAYRSGIFADGERIATIGGGEVLTVYLPAGRRLLGVGGREATKPDREIGVQVTEAKAAFAHLTLSAWGWGGWDIAESSF